MSSEWRYLPILKWKQGEQLALRNLTANQWEGVVPLLELQPINSAPDLASLRSNLPNYLTKTADKISKSIPKGKSIGIDTYCLSVGTVSQAQLLIQSCTYLRNILPDYSIIPVCHASLLESLGYISNKNKELFSSYPEIILRMITDQYDSSQVAPSISLITEIGINEKNIHLLIDQYSIVDRDPNDCFKSVKPFLDNAVLAKPASVTLGGGSFPVNLMGRRSGFSSISRVEWKIWTLVKDSGLYADVRFSDYTVTNPAPLEDIDASKMNPSIAIRYATTDTWGLYKGKGFKSGFAGEYKNLCRILTLNPHYSGEGFSYGDKQYMNASKGGEANGNPSSWRKEATNHHIALTIHSL